MRRPRLRAGGARFAVSRSRGWSPPANLSIIAPVLHKDAKVELIRRIPFFSECSKRELEKIARIADEIDVPAGKTLMKEGELGWECFVMIDGELEVTQDGRRVATRGGSELFGEVALLTDQRRTATVTTVTPARALVLTARDFRDLVHEVPSIAVKVMKSLADRQRPES
jgi:CRP/FNR family transcriptional regulator, cyclic AMP receptor protein